ncbi:hypothetical protein RN001_007793 [Aquatica leii]|uniref:SAP domain-containing protein n=1 Tax=Aquatica leii TaxID=1421715 RepID=A0AAN7SFQ4_9COLE|nr:hypothetical protein RN001_007793 [Aquatica leii]
MADDFLTMADMDITKLKVPDLKRELKLRGLSVSGNKTDLMERLQTSMKSKLDDTASAESVDDLDDDLLNDDDLDHEHLDTSESVLTELEEQLDTSTSNAITKRKLSEDVSDTESRSTKKIVLNRNPSVTNNFEDEDRNGNDSLLISESDKNESNLEESKVIKLSQLSAKERLEMRAKKFGAPVSVEAKKLARAERFSARTTSSSTSDTSEPNLDTLKKRAERFGGSVSKAMSTAEQQERLQKRKERFGVVTTINGTSQNEKAQQRLQRFKTPIT